MRTYGLLQMGQERFVPTPRQPRLESGHCSKAGLQPYRAGPGAHDTVRRSQNLGRHKLRLLSPAQIRPRTTSSTCSILRLRRRRNLLFIHEICASFRIFVMQHHPAQPGRGTAERLRHTLRDPSYGECHSKAEWTDWLTSAGRSKRIEARSSCQTDM